MARGRVATGANSALREQRTQMLEDMSSIKRDHTAQLNQQLMSAQVMTM